jgi:P27 family predicted phage terminase small subunit
MGKRGPRPKPTALKNLQGTYRADRAASNEMRPRAGVPVCPAHLDAAARAEWERVVPELERTGVLTVVDGAALEAYCAMYAMAVRFQKIASMAPMINVPKKGLRTNPAVAEARKHWQLVRQLQAEFGMTPAARTRVGAPAESGQRPDDEELFSGGLKMLPGGKGRREGSASTSASRASGTSEISLSRLSRRDTRVDCTSTEKPATAIVAFIERNCRHHKGSGPGSLLKLEDWEKQDILRPIFGWKRADGTGASGRLGSRSARKNGKTTKAGGVALYMLVGDGEPGRRGLLHGDEGRSGEDPLGRRRSDGEGRAPSCAERIKALRGNLSCAGWARSSGRSAPTATTLDGLNPHAHIPDEVHAHKDAGVWNVLDTGMGARRQPLTLAITTAGTYDLTRSAGRSTSTRSR